MTMDVEFVSFITDKNLSGLDDMSNKVGVTKLEPIIVEITLDHPSIMMGFMLLNFVVFCGFLFRCDLFTMLPVSLVYPFLIAFRFSLSCTLLHYVK